MKRLIAIILMLLIISVVGCTPASPGDTPNDPTTEQPAPADPETEDPAATSDNLWLDENAKANGEVLPRGVSKDHDWIKELKDQTLTLYYAAENDAFTYSSGKAQVDETGWLRLLKDEYDITIHAIRKSEASTLASQRIALLSGKQLDLMSFTPSQLPYALNMTTDATALLEGQNTDFLNQAILSYGESGKRFFTPVGVARNLWYTTKAATSPLSLSESQLWDLTAFGNFVAERTKTEGDTVKAYGYEAHDFTDFLMALGTPVITYEDTFTSTLSSAKNNIKALQTLNSTNGYYYNGQSKEKNAPSLIAGTLAMRYGQTPFLVTAETYPQIEWAPLPTANRHQGKGYVSACAPILALPKDGPQNKAALCAALLWSARAADANHDALRFTYGLSFENWTKYYHATNQQMQIVYKGNDEITAALRRQSVSTTFEETDFNELMDLTATYCINASQRLGNDR